MSDAPATDLICYLNDGWKPLIRPAPRERAWMDATPYGYAYRCLPLAMANAHGWEVLTHSEFSAVWDGGQDKSATRIRHPPGARNPPISLFGSGIITFHMEGIFRTSPGWNLWVSGSPNFFVDGAQALTGLVETDWAPMTFTMNWKLTKPGKAVHFGAGWPICFFFPVPRRVVDGVEPRFASFASDPDLAAEFHAWSQGRNAFHAKIEREQPTNPRDQWQRTYFRGQTETGRKAPDHQTKVVARPFAAAPANDL